MGPLKFLIPITKWKYHKLNQMTSSYPLNGQLFFQIFFWFDAICNPKAYYTLRTFLHKFLGFRVFASFYNQGRYYKIDVKTRKTPKIDAKPW